MSQATVVALLSNVVNAARAYAAAGTELTRTAMLALQGGAHVEDVILAARGGFEEAGEVIPAAFPSNIRRVAKAGPEYVSAVLESERSLNNNLLADLGVPKADSAKGAPTKAKDSPTKATEAKPEGTDTLTILRSIMAKKTQVVDITDVDKFENALLECIALVQRKTAAK